MNEDCEAGADRNRAPDPWAQQTTPGLCFLVHGSHDVRDLSLSTFGTADSFKQSESFLRLAGHGQKAWSFGSQCYEKKKEHGWSDSGQEHPSPVVRACVAEKVIDAIGHQDAGNDRHLIERSHAASD